MLFVLHHLTCNQQGEHSLYCDPDTVYGSAELPEISFYKQLYFMKNGQTGTVQGSYGSLTALVSCFPLILLSFKQKFSHLRKT